MKVGLIGLGIMGRPMAKNLLKAGVELMVSDLNGEAVADVVSCGGKEGTYAEIGASCGIIITMVPSGDIVKSILFGENGVASAVRPGTVVCDMSSVTPTESRECYDRLQKQGVGFVDAPVSGGEPGAVAGTLAIMAGGDQEDFDRMKPYFDILGSSALRIGASGSGSVTKLANQIIVNNTIAVVSEAFVLAVKAGADPEKVYQAIRGGLAGSAVLDAKIPMILERNFKPGGPIRINHKDIRNVVSTAHAIDVPIPYTAQLYEILQTLKIHGHMEDDHGGIVQYFEKLADVQVAKRAMTESADILQSFAPIDEEKIDRLLQEELRKNRKKLVVLDDDPTGVQTVHDISVYTNWEKESIRRGFAEENAMFYILTNSRGLTESRTEAVHREIARTVAEVSAETGQEYMLVSRSDSTLRGHYPLETEVLRECYEETAKKRVDGEILCPFFQEGGRFTIHNIHYVKYGETLVPANETEFAKDPTFGYQAATLPDYIEEKTGGAYRAEDVICISNEEIHAMDIDKIEARLMRAERFQKVIVNAVDEADLKVFAVALYRAMEKGKTFLLRTAASLVKMMGGVTDRPLLTREEMIVKDTATGGIVIVGSHTEKTTAQMEALRELPDVEFIELDASLVKEEKTLAEEVERCLALEETYLKAGKTVCCYTSRELITADTGDKEDELRLSVKISDAVQALVGRLTVTPAFVVAKGGITSSDIGTKALAVRRADVLGQIKPGIPVWRTGEESKFPSMPYVIFPGNVGERLTLKEAVQILMGR